MILVIDNYDSFVYNLVQYLGELLINRGEEPMLEVFRNDKITIPQVQEQHPNQIIISPGPGAPKDAGISNQLIRELAPHIPILGVCLGHQCIGAVYGASIVQAQTLMHGKTSFIHHVNEGIFFGLPNPFQATRYHSLIIHPESLPQELVVTAWTKEGEIMGVKHRDFPLEGVQFHPESILTCSGKDLLKNFLQLYPPPVQTPLPS